MCKRIFYILMLISTSSLASEDVLSLDRFVPNSFDLAFPNEKNIQPDISDFKVINFALMSNQSGERWAIVTIMNQAQGRRTLSHNHLMALIANGKRINPVELSQSFKASETMSLTINFGESKFPLLTVYSRIKT